MIKDHFLRVSQHPSLHQFVQRLTFQTERRPLFIQIMEEFENISWAQTQWLKIFQLFGNSEFNIKVWGTFIVSVAMYWGMGGLFTFVDYTGKPKFMMKYKVQDVKSYPISREQLKDLVQVVLKNQFVVLGIMVAQFYIDDFRGNRLQMELPSLSLAIFSMFVFQVIREITFYYSHRLLHHPLLYKWIHKKHHTWTSPVAIAAAYCHPIEQVVSNALPIALGPALMKSHILLLWAFIIYATIETLTVHSGFHLPLLKSPEFHDFHHLKFNYNYGIFGFLDWVHGTDSLFKKSKQFVRHKRLYTMTPVKTLYPD